MATLIFRISGEPYCLTIASSHYRKLRRADTLGVLRSRLRGEDAGATPVRLPLKSPGDRFGGVGDPSGPDGA